MAHDGFFCWVVSAKHLGNRSESFGKSFAICLKRKWVHCDIIVTYVSAVLTFFAFQLIEHMDFER